MGKPGSDKLVVRLGGIYALDGAMNSRKRAMFQRRRP
jgi:hypothetical protein